MCLCVRASSWHDVEGQWWAQTDQACFLLKKAEGRDFMTNKSQMGDQNGVFSKVFIFYVLHVNRGQ